MSTRRAVVLNAGALGDSVLVWPLLRALVAAGFETEFVANREKANLAAARLGVAEGRIRAVSIEQERFTRLWRGPDAMAAADADASVVLVVSFLTGDNADAAAEIWSAAAARLWPSAEIVLAGPPRSPSRARLWARFEVDRAEAALLVRRTEGNVVMHLGAGGKAKRWPLAQWVSLGNALRNRRYRTEAIIGEVEMDRFGVEEHRAAERLGAMATPTLADLADRLSRARLFIGVDTGPTHLAAQLGVPTLALFGPTDPAVWRPVGPAVRVLAPPVPGPMSWLDAARVLAEAESMLAE